MVKWNNKCRFFNEKYACETLSSEGYESCEECKFSAPYSKKILILKFGAMGDVLRTTPILFALRKKYGEDVLVYWMTSSGSVELLENNPLIDKILFYNLENVLRIQQEKFDILYSLEVDTPATLIANTVKADKKYGFYFDNGSTSCFNKNAESYLETAFLHHKKLQNRRTYQDLIFEACELEYNKEKPVLNLSEKDKNFGKRFAEENNLSEVDKIIGIHIGSADRWKSKFWDNEKIKELIRKISDNYKIIIFGGPNEVQKQKEIIESMQKEGIYLIKNNPNNSIGEFTTVVNLCEIIICGDSLAMHISSSLGKKTIALFFSTPDWEVEDYGIIQKITSPLLEKYFYVGDFIPELAESISIDEVIDILNKNI
ncbi:MAG: glycosyltransferase family 9 protein [archaeon]